MPFRWRLKKLNHIFASSSTDPIKNEPTYAVISPIADGGSILNILRFDHKKNFAFCVGIDKKEEIVDEIITRDVTEISETFRTILGLNSDQIKVSKASNVNDDCTKEGLRDSFTTCAKRVEENGNFIFYFAGHGYGCHNRCILSPADYNSRDVKSGISGDDLVNWLNITECKANNLLFVFDCCFAGNLGEMLTMDENLKTKANLFVMCGCKPNEKVSSFSILRHSIFTYFLLDYLKTWVCTKELDIEKAMDIIPGWCSSFSCLLRVYIQGKLHDSTFTPSLYIKHEGFSKAASEKAIVTLLNRLIKEKTEWPLKRLENWLQSPDIKKALSILCPSTAPSENLQEAIVSALLYSAAFIQYEDTSNKKLLEKRELFLQIAIKVSTSIKFFDITIDHVIIGLEHYLCAVKSLRINPSELCILYQDMNDHNKSITDDIDSYLQL